MEEKRKNGRERKCFIWTINILCEVHKIAMCKIAIYWCNGEHLETNDALNLISTDQLIQLSKFLHPFLIKQLLLL